MSANGEPAVAAEFPHRKIVVENPVVELDGDEMTRIIWKQIRQEVHPMSLTYCVGI
jgi:isocitrate dehydrogenase